MLLVYGFFTKTALKLVWGGFFVKNKTSCLGVVLKGTLLFRKEHKVCYSEILN